MAYRGLTTLGANYLATRLAGELPVEFTKIQIGAGTPTGNPADTTELKNYKLDGKILKKTQENNTVEITVQVVNDNIEQGFYLKEIGVFVNDNGEEKLYWYCNEDNAQYVPAKTDSAIAFEIDIKMEVTNIESPILNWSGQGTWIDKDYLEGELAKKQDLTENRLLTKAKKIWEGINELFNTKLEKGGYTGTAKNLNDEISKKASKTQLGRVIVGDGLNVDKNARLSVAQHTHTATEIVEDSTHRTVTDGEKASWNGKFDRGVVPASLNNAEKVIAALKGNGGLKFDDTLLYLNDAGTKKVGYMYLDKLTEGIFECIGQTTTTVNNSSYFRNISNKENSDRLENLGKTKWIKTIVLNSSEPKFLAEQIDIFHYKKICILGHSKPCGSEFYKEILLENYTEYITIPYFIVPYGVVSGDNLTKAHSCYYASFKVGNKTLYISNVEHKQTLEIRIYGIE